jgi:undecaprenyl-diphosphatase
MPEFFTTTFFKRASSILLVLAFLGLIALAIIVHHHKILGLDVFLSRDLQARGSSVGRRRLIFDYFYSVSFFGGTLIAGIMVFVTALCFWLLKYYRETIFCLLTTIATAINAGIKLIVNRPRPSEPLIHVVTREMDASFPSGHVVFYTVFFGFLIAAMFYTQKIPKWLRATIAIISLVLIISISFSRVYLGAHWATDVIAGYLEGFILLFILLYFYFSRMPKRS